MEWLNTLILLAILFVTLRNRNITVEIVQNPIETETEPVSIEVSEPEKPFGEGPVDVDDLLTELSEHILVFGAMGNNAFALTDWLIGPEYRNSRHDGIHKPYVWYELETE